MKGNRAANKKIFCIILFVFVLPVFGQTEKPLSEFEKHRQKAAEFAEKQDWKNCLFELEILLKIASTKEEKINANNWLGGYYLYYIEPKNFLKAIPFFEEVIKLDDKDLSAIEGLGIIYANDKIIEVKIKKALPFLLHAEKFSSKNSVIYYNISCIYSLLKEIEKAIQYLDKAIYTGYENIEWIQKDSDFDNIRKTEYYTRLVTNWEKVKLGREAMNEGQKAKTAAKYDLALQKFFEIRGIVYCCSGKGRFTRRRIIWLGLQCL
jgi:tetratricopeptide (TPR) repeat protein